MASKNSELWQQARHARDTLVDRFVDHPAVSLIDIGYDPEPQPGEDPDRVVVRVHVRRPRAELSLDLPPEVEGIAIRVVDGDYQPERGSAPQALAEKPGGEAQAPARGRRRKGGAPGPRKGAADQDAGPPEPGWEALAEFAVAFGRVRAADGEPHVETRVRHVPSGEATSWPGMALDELAAWMSRRASLPLPGSVSEQPEGSAERDEVELSGLWVSQDRAAGHPGWSGVTNALRAEVCFSVVAARPAVLAAGEVPYTIEFWLTNSETNESSSAAVYRGMVRPGEMDCPIEQDLPIPPPGRYQLDLVARLLPPGNGLGRLSGPVIVVEE